MVPALKLFHVIFINHILTLVSSILTVLIQIISFRNDVFELLT